MVKSDKDVIKDFNEIVNMTAEELEAFLETDASTTTGYTREGEDESVGHQSGTKIVDILKRNPDKDPSSYTEEDLEHMHRVVAYCKRHLAQEGHLKEEKTEEELEKMKSTRSLKNWGHDPLKSKGGVDGGENKPKSSGKPTSKKAAKKDEADKEETEKPKSKSAKPSSKKAAENKDVKEKEAGKPASKSATKPASKKGAAKEEPLKEKEDAKEKRAAEKPEAEDKPAKKAKTEKPAAEGSRKPPSRSAKKA